MHDFILLVILGLDFFFYDWERRSNSPRKRLNTAASSGFNWWKCAEISESALTRSV
jgi:hypothetical protein